VLQQIQMGLTSRSWLVRRMSLFPWGCTQYFIALELSTHSSHRGGSAQFEISEARWDDQTSARPEYGAITRFGMSDNGSPFWASYASSVTGPKLW